jgi:hypothetical protein
MSTTGCKKRHQNWVAKSKLRAGDTKTKSEALHTDSTKETSRKRITHGALERENETKARI